MRENFKLHTLWVKFVECLRDNRGTAMTEYLVLTAVTLPMVFYLFHPDNGFYAGARAHFETTALILTFPGP